MERCGCGKPAVLALREKEVKRLPIPYGKKKDGYTYYETGRTVLIPRCFEHAVTTHKILKKEAESEKRSTH